MYGCSAPSDSSSFRPDNGIGHSDATPATGRYPHSPVTTRDDLKTPLGGLHRRAPKRESQYGLNLDIENSPSGFGDTTVCVVTPMSRSSEVDIDTLAVGKHNHHDLLHHHGYPRVALPEWLRPLLAEALGIMTMLILGCGSNINANLGRADANFVAYAFGWGVGLAMALFVSIPISGGHLNPVITITQALFRGFPWKKVPGYILAQLVGAFLAGVIVNGIFYELLNKAEGGYGLRTYYGANATASWFIIVPVPYDTNITAFFENIVGAALLIAGVAVVTDDDLAGDWPMYIKALIMQWVMIGVSGCMGVATPFALNPARDLGPRLACFAFGYPSALWTDRHWFWVWGTVIAPILGGIIAMVIYDLVVRRGLHITIPSLKNS